MSRFDAPFVAKVINASWAATGSDRLPKELTESFVQPMLRRLEAELFDVCQHRCHRINTKPAVLSEKQIESYWHRLTEDDDKAEGDGKEEIFVMEVQKIKCDVGFKSGCPYFSEDEKTLEQRLETFRATILFRLERFKKRKEDPLQGPAGPLSIHGTP